jgi:hypothetical protein
MTEMWKVVDPKSHCAWYCLEEHLRMCLRSREAQLHTLDKSVALTVVVAGREGTLYKVRVRIVRNGGDTREGASLYRGPSKRAARRDRRPSRGNGNRRKSEGPALSLISGTGDRLARIDCEDAGDTRVRWFLRSRSLGTSQACSTVRTHPDLEFATRLFATPGQST